MSSILRGNDSFDTGDYKEHISVPTNYHIYNGEVTATNTVVTNGFSTTLYTGNGSTQSINTDVDMYTQWGNDASETFGGLTWIKGRSGATSNYLMDTVRGATKNIYSNATTAETTEATGLTSFTGTGFNTGSLAGMNTNTATYASWNFQTTHRKTGTTNHGKAYTEHYNPFTGFTMIKYEGSGLAGHEIPHSLGRKLDFRVVKNLSSTVEWVYSGIGAEIGYYMYLNSTIASSTTAVLSESNNSSIIYSGTIGSSTNTSTNTYILYGWANSYYDEANTLIGNYEIGVYQGTGAAGNKVTTRGKPAWVMAKRLDSTGFWWIGDNQRGNGTLSLYANASNAEANDINDCTFESNSFTLTGVGNDSNASGGQYIYMVVYDNDSGSGKSKYPKATDTTNLNINALVPYANGIDAKGSKVTVVIKNETITLSNSLVQGKNYIASLNNGTYVAKQKEPSYGKDNPLVSGQDFYNLNTCKWYDNVNAEITPRTYLDCIAYADQNGQVEYVEQLPKTVYVDEIKANEFKGKNSCTAWVNLDGETPAILDSYNVAYIIRVSTGVYDIYFKEAMDNANYSVCVSTGDGNSIRTVTAHYVYGTVNKVTVVSRVSLGSGYDVVENHGVSVHIFGGKN